MGLEHAIHNEKLCDMLLSTKKYNDWVVTTAFYSAIHFIDHKLFPCVINGKDYKTFNLYYDVAVKSNQLSKHTLKAKLISDMLPKINAEYRWLKDACQTARYVDYLVTTGQAEAANLYLKTIKRNCNS